MNRSDAGKLGAEKAGLIRSRGAPILTPGPRVTYSRDRLGNYWRRDPVGLWLWLSRKGYWTLARMARPR